MAGGSARLLSIAARYFFETLFYLPTINLK